MMAGHLGRDAGPDPRRGRARVQDAGRRRALSFHIESGACNCRILGEGHQYCMGTGEGIEGRAAPDPSVT